ncbi:MAG: hypothetical protein ACE37H_15035 [Phycisphaeraceae bacterium]
MARVRSGNTGYAVALVIFGCAFVISLLVAIILYTKIETHKNAEDAAKNELAKYVAPGETGPAGEYIGDGQTAYAGMQAKIDELSKALNGVPGEKGAVQKLEDAQAEITKKDKGYNLLDAELQEAKATLKSERTQFATMRAQMMDKVNAEIAEKQALQAQVADLQTKVTQAIGDADAAARDRIAELTQQVGELENTIRDREAVIDQQLIAIRELRDQLPTLPEPNTTLPDGRVASTFNSGRDLFINLGRRDGIVMGMTFEVFDPDPVIRLSAQGEARGKATIEVYGLEADTATCRVVRMDRGEQIDPEDPIVNISYDPNMTIRMFAFGDFDIEGDGGGNDIERINALIRKNGGEIPELTLGDDGIPVLTPDLDYVILGEKPVLGSPPDQSGDFNPEAIAAYQAKKAQVDAYFSISEAAKQMRIPVLNQNRFLELSGYYER